MTVNYQTFNFKSKAYCDVINITSEVQNSIKKSGIENGIINVHVAGSTGAISTTEYEPGLVDHDIRNLLEKLTQNYSTVTDFAKFLGLSISHLSSLAIL